MEDWLFLVVNSDGGTYTAILHGTESQVARFCAMQAREIRDADRETFESGSTRISDWKLATYAPIMEGTVMFQDYHVDISAEKMSNIPHRTLGKETAHD